MIKKDIPVLVTGIERSGSSLIARIINICGGFCGETTEMYENKKICQLVNNYYNFNGVDVHGQYPLPDTKNLLIPFSWKKEVTSILDKEKYDGGVWFYKSSRIGQIWPIWNYAFPEARWIIVRRRTGDIIQSCLKTDYMNAFKNEEIRKQVGVDTVEQGWLWWIHEHEKRFIEMLETGVNAKIIWPDRMVNGDYRQIFEMIDWLGLEWNSRILTEIDPLLQKERRR